jgi:3-hydroxyacyl-CoA dehydrogenase
MTVFKLDADKRIIAAVDATDRTREGIPGGPRKLLRRYIDEGRLGAKSGRGFYDHQT